MPSAEIRETIATPADASGGAVVQIQISDVPLADVSEATLHLNLSVSVPGFEAPLHANGMGGGGGGLNPTEFPGLPGTGEARGMM